MPPTRERRWCDPPGCRHLLFGEPQTDGAANTTVESTIGYTYDATNRITGVTAEGHTVGYTYNAAQQVSEVTYPSSEVVKYEYDSRKALSGIKDGTNAPIATYTRDNAGRLTRRVLPNGLETIYTWNDSNWLTKLELREVANPSNVLQSFEYGYDNVGNRLWIKTKDGRGDVYRYDAIYQVTGVKYNVDNPTVGYDIATNYSRVVTYQYDAVGNRISVTENGVPASYTTNSLNQYTNVGGTSYTYSSRGDLVGGAVAGGIVGGFHGGLKGVFSGAFAGGVAGLVAAATFNPAAGAAAFAGLSPGLAAAAGGAASGALGGAAGALASELTDECEGVNWGNVELGAGVGLVTGSLTGVMGAYGASAAMGSPASNTAGVAQMAVGIAEGAMTGAGPYY